MTRDLAEVVQIVQLARRTLRSPNVLLASDLLEGAIAKLESMLVDVDRAQQLHEMHTATAIVARRGRRFPPERGQQRVPESSPDGGTCRPR